MWLMNVYFAGALMSSVSATVNKFTYDAVKCRERIQFGNYRFVRISGEFHVPAFKVTTTICFG